MDIALARPPLRSLDGALLLAALLAATGGLYLVFTRIGELVGVLGWALVALAVALTLPRAFLGVEIDEEGLAIHTLTGERRVPLAEITRLQILQARVPPLALGLGAAGYHTGTVEIPEEGEVHAYVSRLQGRFLVVDHPDGDVLLSPHDPSEILQELKARAEAARSR